MGRHRSTPSLTSKQEGVFGSGHASATLTPGKTPVPIVQEAAQAREPIWTGEENFISEQDSIP